MQKSLIIILILFAFSLFFGCTGSDTFIIQNVKLEKLFDGNVSGDSGLIPFLNLDGNKLEVSSGFDFNKDTNTLSTNCIELGDGNSYCSSTDFPNPDLTNYLTTTNNQIPVYTTATAASNSIKEILITGSVETGQIIGVKFTSGSTTNITMRIRVNKDLPDVKVGIVYLGGSASYKGALILGANSILYVQWDGTRWNVVGGTVAPPETNSFIPLHSDLKAGETIYNYVFAMVGGDGLVYPLILTSSTSSTKPVSSRGFDISKGVMFNPGKGTQTTGANLRDIMYFGGINPSEAYALNSVSGFALYKNIYLKGTINQTDGLFYLERSGYDTWYTQTLPTTEDGYVYVLFATHMGGNLSVSFQNPAYWFKNGRIRLYGEYANTDRQDDFKEYFGTDNDSSVNFDGTNLVLDPDTTGTDSGLVYVDGNVSATGFITRTSVYDKSKGSALDKIKDADSLVNVDKSIMHENFFGYTPIQVTDYSRPVIITKDVKNCFFDEKDKEFCEIEKVSTTTYPYKRIEGGVDLGIEIDVLRQAVYELKTELCKKDSNYEWCKVIK